MTDVKTAQPVARGRRLHTGHGHWFTKWPEEARVEATLEIFLPIESPPINEVMRKMGKSLPAWKAKMIAADKMRKFYGEALSLALIGFDLPPARVALVRIRSYRWNLCDHDGLVAGLKYLLDRLRDMRVIVDDSERWIGRADVQQSIERANRRTEITIEYMRA